MGGFLTGVVRERSGTAMPGVEVRIQSETTGAQQKVLSDENGKFVSAELAPGSYRVTLRRRGFRTASYPGLSVEAGKSAAGDFAIDLVPLQQEVTVESDRDTTDPAANGVAVSRQSKESGFPANGRDLHAYYALVPGATLTPASSSDGGQFTVNGQRPNTNTVRVDGMNANTGLGVSGLPGTYPGSSLPAMTAIGSTQSVASKEEIERTELRSSDFSPESGERPGAQISIETRSGSNDFHGSVFGLLRPRTLDSGDWFSRKYQAPLKASSLNGYGASLGGALVPNRTFFFVAVEREQVAATAMQLMAVPSQPARAGANSGAALLLNAFPEPTGPSLGAGTALATVPLQQQASVENYSVRIDQIFGDKARLFARYSNVPSRSSTQQLGNIAAALRSVSATAGLTGTWLGAVNDLRFNFSRASDTSSWAAGSANQRAAFDAFPNPPSAAQASVLSGSSLMSLDDPFGTVIDALSISGVGQLVSGTAESTNQNQWESAYTFSKQLGRHEFRFGGDYIRLIPDTLIGRFGGSTISVVSAGVEPLLAGGPLGLTSSLGKPIIDHGQISIGSSFVQDTFHPNSALSILFGLRWEITPPSSTISPTYLNSIGTWTGPGAAPTNGSGGFAGLGELTWIANYKQFAPRVGLAYRLRGPGLVLRAGGGIFYETALGSLVHPVNLSPLNTWQFVPASGAASPPITSPIDNVPPPLSLPRSWEWRASVERSLWERSTLSLAYTGSVGSRLLRLQGTVDPGSELLRQTYFTSYGASNYQALQAQFRGNLTPNLNTLISYTWGHSMDNGSQGSAVYLAQQSDRASSDFDIRHNVNASLSYRVPPHFNGRWQEWTKNWTLSSTVEARSGFPFDVTTIDRSIGLGFANTGRPNVVPGQTIWIRDSGVPGGRELNPKAFQPPAGGFNGTLGRNVLTGPGLFQIDASLRRQFRLFTGSSLEAGVSAFNLLNHASFAGPTGYLGSPLFGQPVSMQNLMMGSGNPTNGLTPLFQSGGPRTMEISLRINF